MPLHIDNKLKGKWVNFPKHDIDPKKKGHDWCLNFCKAIYSKYVNDETYFTNKFYKNVERIRAYARGQQPSGIYKDGLLGEAEGGPRGEDARKGYVNLNFDEIFSPAPKYKAVIKGMFESIDQTITVSAEDEISGTEKLNQKEMLWMKKEQEPFLQMIDEKLGIKQPPPDFMPQSRRELEMFEAMGGFKLRYEVGMEKALNHTFYLSEWKQIKRKLIDDFVDCNMAATMDEVDVYSQKVKLKYIDFSDLIIEYCRDNDFTKSRWGAIPIDYTIEELRTSGCTLTEDELRSIANNFCGYRNNPPSSRFGNYCTMSSDHGVTSYGYDHFIIPVMYAAWKSTDSQYKVKRSGKNGTVTYNGEYGKIKESEKKKTTIVDVRTIYHAKWILGTEHVFDYGLMNDIPRKGNEAFLPFHVYKMEGKSIMESIIPLLDDIQFTYLKLQNARNQAAPPGLIIEIGALENISLGNKSMDPLELIKIYQQNGTVFYRATPYGSTYQNYNSGPPIVPHSGGMGSAIQEAMQSFEMAFGHIAELTGISRISGGVAPPSDQPVGATKLSAAATSNVLKPIFSGYLHIKESCARNASFRIQLICKYNKNKDIGYYSVIGKDDYQAVVDASNNPAIYFGIRIETMPTEEIRAEILEAAKIAMQGGKNGVPALNWGEYLFIQERLNAGAGFAEMRAFIAYREQQAAQQAALTQEANMKANGEQARATQEAKSQQELLKIQAEAEAQIAIDKNKYDLELRNEQAKLGFEAQKEQRKVVHPIQFSKPIPAADQIAIEQENA